MKPYEILQKDEKKRVLGILKGILADNEKIKRYNVLQSVIGKK